MFRSRWSVPARCVYGIYATAVDPLDYQIRRGDYPEYVPLPAIIGHDVSGVVEDVGREVSEFGVRRP
ncbi:MAG: alcohol dehydrogenase catalytic domain-containing protein [Mycolicibacterium neoaurum]|uniref:alcohol dehydrogenase catalytic domain-containing protein n=1 Tax=Mycolicibacterium neoaurum TaxID=1795 RepID=UPI002FFD14CC